MADNLDMIIEGIRDELSSLRVKVAVIENMIAADNRLHSTSLTATNSRLEKLEHAVNELLNAAARASANEEMGAKQISDLLKQVDEVLETAKETAKGGRRDELSPLGPKEWAAIILGILTLATLATEALKAVALRNP